LEGYDLALGRHLMAGVDVWLNTPEYPLEASGTSGQKAGMNGVINLSVLDGWWGEGYNGENGWAIAPQNINYDPAYRNQEEAKELLDILEHQVIPMYYDRNGHGFSEQWVRMSKASMKSTLPRFNSQRMLMDYIRDYYSPASHQSRALAENKGQGAIELSAWKKKVKQAWPGVKLRLTQNYTPYINARQELKLVVAATLNGLSPNDVEVECQVGTQNEQHEFIAQACFIFRATGQENELETRFELDLQPPLPGLQRYRIRMYPKHKLLGQSFELGCMVWV